MRTVQRVQYSRRVFRGRKEARAKRERLRQQQTEHAEIRRVVQNHLAEDGGLTQEGMAALRAHLQEIGYIVDNTVNGDELPSDVYAAWMIGLTRTGDFMPVSGNAILPAEEPARFVAGADLLKEIPIREYQGGSQGVSVPLGHGVRWRASAIRGQLVTVGHRWETLDEGQLTVTDRRIIFTGRRRTVEFQFAKLVNMSLYSDGVALGVSNRQETSTFRVNLPSLFAHMVRASMAAGPELVRAAAASDEPTPDSRRLLRRPVEAQRREPTDRAAALPPAGGGENRWPAVLAAGGTTPWLGQLLAEHPQADAKTRVVLQGLSVERLVRLANVQHNRCRRDSLRDVERISRQRASDQAWTQLLTGLSDMQMRDGTAWTGTIKLLMPGSETALEQIGRMDITQLIGVCQRLIQVPYAEARHRGIT